MSSSHSRNMSEQKQAPMPLWQDKPRPSWPSKWELTESLVTKNHQEFPRGGSLLKPIEYHMFLYKSLLAELKQVFVLFIGTFGPADDHSAKSFYIERFVFISETKFKSLVQWLIDNQRKKFTEISVLFGHIEISKYFCLELRKREKWYGYRTWRDVVGYVALKYDSRVFWNQNKLDIEKATYLQRHPNCEFARQIQPESISVLTEEMNKLLSGRLKCYTTPYKEVTPYQLSNYDWKSGHRGSVRWCPTLIWLLFDFPMAFHQFSNAPTRYQWSGCLKIGTVNQLMPKVPDSCFNQAELEKFVDKKRSRKSKKYGDCLFVNLRKILSSNVCNMIV